MSDEVSHYLGLVLYLILLLAPGSEARKSLLAHKVVTRYGSHSVWFRYLVIDERIVKIYRLRIILRIAIDNTRHSRPIKC